MFPLQNHINLISKRNATQNRRIGTLHIVLSEVTWFNFNFFSHPLIDASRSYRHKYIKLWLKRRIESLPQISRCGSTRNTVKNDTGGEPAFPYKDTR